MNSFDEKLHHIFELAKSAAAPLSNIATVGHVTVSPGASDVLFLCLQPPLMTDERRAKLVWSKEDALEADAPAGDILQQVAQAAALGDNWSVQYLFQYPENDAYPPQELPKIQHGSWFLSEQLKLSLQLLHQLRPELIVLLGEDVATFALHHPDKPAGMSMGLRTISDPHFACSYIIGDSEDRGPMHKVNTLVMTPVIKADDLKSLSGEEVLAFAASIRQVREEVPRFYLSRMQHAQVSAAESKWARIWECFEECKALRSEKNDAINQQWYEKAAAIRDQEVKCHIKLLALLEETS